MAKVVPPGAPAPHSVLGWDGTDFYVLRTDATGHLQVDVLTSALPAGGATAAHQVTQITALQLIDDLRNALQSVATDRLKVRGEDQLFTFKGGLAVRALYVLTAANGAVETTVVPAGEIWVVTTMTAANTVRASTRVVLSARHDGAAYSARSEDKAWGIDERIGWAGHVYLDVGDSILATFIGGQIGDLCVLDILGYRMTAEV